MLDLLGKPERIKQAIIEKTGISEQELAEKVRSKQEEFHGLINEAAALYSIAKEMGIEIQLERKDLIFTPIKQLTPGMQGINIHARVMKVLAPRKFEKEGRKGRVCNLLIADNTGEATLVLWHRDVELVERGVIEKGDAVDVLGAYVKNTGEVHLSLGGQILKVKEREKLPEAKAQLKKINEFGEGMSGVDFVAEVVEVGAVNSFEKNGRMKQVASLFVADETGRIRVSLWNGNASLVERLKAGDKVKIEDAYIKEGFFGKEAHVDWRGRIVINPKVELPPLAVERLRRVKINELKEGEAVEIEGEVIEGNARTYKFCNKCKVTARDVCPKCGSSELERRFAVSIILKDETGGINCVLFGDVAKEFLGIKEIPEDVEPETILELKKGDWKGRRIVVKGKARRSSFTGDIEFIVKGVV
ncbi:MAG: DUF2240 family protein [Candidatus Micrarchaeia archaeon]